MKRRFFCLALSAVLGLGSLLLAGSSVSAQSLDQYRISGAVGEGSDGYLIIRKGGGGVEAFVAGVNGKRRSVYAMRAEKQGVPAVQVGRVYAKNIMKMAPAGTWFKTASQGWIQK